MHGLMNIFVCNQRTLRFSGSLLICLSFSLLTFISTVKSSWRHIWALIFAQSHVGWTQGELVRRVGERGEQEREKRKSKKERQKGGRKPPQTSIWQKQGAGLTLTTFDMWKLWVERDAETTAKQEEEGGGEESQKKRRRFHFPTLWLPFLHFQQRN